MPTHPACGKSWTGNKPEHCPACCETFTGTEAGDKHRVGDPNLPKGSAGGRRCLTAEEMAAAGLELDERGHWRRARPGKVHAFAR